MMQTVSSDVDREVLLAELDLHKEEFSALRTEILQWLETERLYLNMSLVAIGAALGVAPYILEQRAFISLLLFPVVFHVLLWEMLSSKMIVGHLSSYLVDHLIPRVNAILDELGDDRKGTIVFGWEVQVKTSPLKTADWVMASLAPTRHWVPILAVATLIIFYIIVTNSYGHSPSVIEILLIVVNLLFLILAAMRNVTGARSAVRETRRLLQQDAGKEQDRERKNLKPSNENKRSA